MGQNDWTAAEHFYRESLALVERVGDPAGQVQTYNRQVVVAMMTGRPTEAEGCYKRALELCDTLQPDSREQAAVLNKLAYLLLSEIRADRARATRLTEARGYAERAVAILETLEASSGAWAPLNILSDIAEVEGRTEEARVYRRREREAYAAFAGNRYHIDQYLGTLIPNIVAGAQGDEQAQKVVEKVLSQLEAKGRQIIEAIRRIWAGEREWHALVERMGNNSGLLVRRVLETLGQGTQEE